MTHYVEVVSSNPGTIYWIDVSDARAISYQTMKISKIKVAKWGTSKKLNLPKHTCKLLNHHAKSRVLSLLVLAEPPNKNSTTLPTPK
jgi:hypothetical protein